ncbi:MAG: 50S ribosomal protein L11 methyltransferase [Elusimicrobia bacterium]|nr:50S ribosomal protein L11 methyltransferase [Elusimicrobiota bacterium]
MKRTLPTLALLLAAVHPAGAQPSKTLQRYHSAHLGAEIEVYPGIPFREPGEPCEAEDLVLPILAAHKELFAGKTVMDLGVGSGIMSIYAAKLGARKIIGTDINPDAIKNTRENAKKLGVEGGVLDLRLVSLKDPGAFSVVGKDETVDLFMTNPPYKIAHVMTNRAATADLLDAHTTLALSILEGLDRHLNAGGRALLLYRSKFLHEFVVRRAESLGFEVEHHGTDVVLPTDWCIHYNERAAAVAKAAGLKAQELLIGTEECWGDPMSSRLAAAYELAAVEKKSARYPPLWGKTFDRAFPGIILLRKKSK